MRSRILLFLWLSPLFLLAQKLDNQTNKQVFIKKANSAIKIDGDLDDASWTDAAEMKDFIDKYPQNGGLSRIKTNVKITYDENYLYVGAICFATKPYIISTLKRDISLINNDGLSVVLDPVNIKSNGFSFGCSAYGVQTESLVSAGSRDPNFEWDTKWFSEVKQYDDRYTIEMAIPFKALRYENGKNEWGINIIRSDMKTGEFSTWANVPIQFPGFDLGYLGKMIWDEAPRSKKNNISLLPYISASYSKEVNKTTGGFDEITKPNIGFDAKIALSSSLNLDVTTNPDFSQVDVDKQVTNLTRFDIFLPERRTFFLENGDIFTNFGVPPIRPFFSRTVGLDADGLPQPILYGLRLTGNVRKNTRIGLMNTHTLGKGNTAGQNVSMATIQQNIHGRSYIKGMFLNRQAFESSKILDANYGRNAGLEAAFISNDGKWTVTGAYHVSDKPTVKGKNDFALFSINFSGRNFSIFSDIAPVQENFYADQGFIARIKNYDAEKGVFVRQGFIQSYSTGKYNFYPKKSGDWFQRQDLSIENFLVLNPNRSFNERNTTFSYHLTLKNTVNLTIAAVNSDIALNFPTSFKTVKPLPTDRYHFNNANVMFLSDKRKLFSYSLTGKIGSFYNGTIQSGAVGLIYRVRPWGNFETNYEYNRLQFPVEYGSSQLQLFGGKVEINFNRNLAWTTFVQINTQNDRFNFNSRFQWRFKPMSDLFLVYTDNYSRSDKLPKYRALVLKLSYWLNV
jgi:Domain of unknown function (DUF5916)/Carbohydrate family 9 binding domain-like